MGSYISWQWRMMQNLNRNWLASSKLRSRIWQMLTQAIKTFKNLHLNGLLLTKVNSLRFKGEVCVMTMNNNSKYEEDLTFQFKIDLRNLKHFVSNTQISQKSVFSGLLLTKYIIFGFSKYTNSLKKLKNSLKTQAELANLRSHFGKQVSFSSFFFFSHDANKTRSNCVKKTHINTL